MKRKPNGSEFTDKSQPKIRFVPAKRISNESVDNQKLGFRVRQCFGQRWNIILIGLWVITIFVIISLVAFGFLTLYEGVQIFFTASLVFVTMFYASETYRMRRESVHPSLSLRLDWSNIGHGSVLRLLNSGSVARELYIDTKSVVPVNTQGLFIPEDRTLFLPALDKGYTVGLPAKVAELERLHGLVEVKVRYRDRLNAEFMEEFLLDFGRLKQEGREIVFQWPLDND
jgi:hypothetical protein